MTSTNYLRWFALSLFCGASVSLGGCPGASTSPVETKPPGPNLSAAVNPTCARTIYADVVTLSQPLQYNRMGTAQVSSQIFALARDVEVNTNAGDGPATWAWLPATPSWQAYETCRQGGGACTAELATVADTYQTPANKPVRSRIRTDRRPRPMVLRANVGDCLEVNLANLLPDAPQPAGNQFLNTNFVGFHPVGMSVVETIDDDGQMVGKNPDGLTHPGGAQQYKYFAQAEAVHFVSSSTDENDTMINVGLFGAVHVQPRTAEYYRSQVTADDLALASSLVGSNRIINYQATFGADTQRPAWKRGVPILNMLMDRGNGRLQLIYSDLTAIITGANAGRFADDIISPTFAENPATPDRRQPYREFTIIYHEPGGAAQAFPQQAPATQINGTLQYGNDAFGINYGTGGIGAEILANRLGVGPMADCVDCRYEEFFLSAWTVGDPAMIVDKPAALNVGTTNKATLAYYPDDPSNVYHSYLSDHVKMRLHHGGATHHVHHLHAHQWLHTPNSTTGHYLDSQLFGPGSSFTLEMVYNGSGNRNQTVGDSIFHCHFYPHFAQGMWAMWRVHDVFEAGTELEAAPSANPAILAAQMRPKPGSRALPDGEIDSGTPIPGLVPLPTLPMAPAPSPIYIDKGQVYFGTYAAAPGPTAADTRDRWGDGVTVNPGYPFFIPGKAGHRPPHPPKDFATVVGATGTVTTLDGGLPRHLIEDGEDAAHFENLYDFSKFSKSLKGRQLPEDGTPIEKVAMAAHAQRDHASATPEGKPGNFIYNGKPAVAGAPFADPCPLAPMPAPMRHYRAADIQHDVVLNKDGWHNPQQRMTVLWNDIQDTFNNTRPPQPFFFRANSQQCIEFWLTNLVPSYYELDNFQVRTPTDILGQHIHLVKFDVTSSDGAANGWNYEDGTFSYEEVQDRLADMKAPGGGLLTLKGAKVNLGAPVVPQYLCDAGVTNCKKYAGAQTTVQRWWADPLLSSLGGPDRTIRTVFTHDHFGPSTHQQAGLYSGLLVEPENSTWIAAETDENGKTVALGGRSDGGPTSWQAVIQTPNASDSYREFALEFQDMALAYTAGTTKRAAYPAANKTMSPTAVTAQNNLLNGTAPTAASTIRTKVGGYMYCPTCTGSTAPVAAPVTPQLVSSIKLSLENPVWGTYSVNYRSEPLAMRLADASLATAKCPAGDQACDTASVYTSIPRTNPDLNSQHVGQAGYPPALTSGVYGTDPFTPMLRAYAGERVQIRTLVGAHVQMHNFSLHGMQWLFEPSNVQSGYRDSQSMGISEHFEMEFQMPPATTQAAPASAGPPTNTCSATQPDGAFTDYLYMPSSSREGQTQGNWGLLRSYAPGAAQCLAPVPGTPAPGTWACPPGAPARRFNVAAFNQSLTYNSATNPAISNANGLVYTGCEGAGCTPPAPGPEMNPLILRVAAGDCITVALTNNFTASNPTFTTPSSLTAYGNAAIAGSVTFDKVQASPSVNAGLHPQMLAFDPAKGSGINAGFNPTQTAAPGQTVQYVWYAGIIAPGGAGTPVEYGAVNLFAADPLRQANIGLIGALVVEPKGSTWPAAEAGAPLTQVTKADGKTFSDAVLITVDTRLNNSPALTDVLANYATEPMSNRFTTTQNNIACQYSDLLLNSATGAPRDPETPIYAVKPGAEVRFRVVHPWGGDQQVFELFGHLWQEEPWLTGSTVIGDNRTSEHQGFKAGWGATDRVNVIIDSAGGPFAVAGDYLYRLRNTRLSASQGVWGLLRVGVAASTNAGTSPFFCKPTYPNAPPVTTPPTPSPTPAPAM